MKDPALVQNTFCFGDRQTDRQTDRPLGAKRQPIKAELLFVSLDRIIVVTVSDWTVEVGTALSASIPGLSLGQTYTATLMDLRAETELASFSFTACQSGCSAALQFTPCFADPNCSAGRQEELLCLTTVANLTPGEAGPACTALGLQLWDGEGELARLAGGAGGAAGWAGVEPGACRAWQGGQPVPRPCNSSLAALCYLDQAAALQYPRPQDQLDIGLVGGSEGTLIIARREASQGWVANYSVQVDIFDVEYIMCYM